MVDLPTPVLVIRDARVTAALVELYDADANVPVSVDRAVGPDASAASVLDAAASAAHELGDLRGAHWGVSLPSGVESAASGAIEWHEVPGDGASRLGDLSSVAVVAGLVARLARAEPLPTFALLDTVTASALGEWLAGAGRGASRLLYVCLDARRTCLLVDGRPTEGGVRTTGDPDALAGVLRAVRDEGPDRVVVCGRGPTADELAALLAGDGQPQVRPAELADLAPLIGAALHASRTG